MKNLRFLIKYWRLIITGVFASIVASLMEVVSISLLFPIIQGAGIKGNSGDIPAPFKYIFQTLSNVSLSKTLQIVALILIISFGIKGTMLFLSGICSVKLANIISKHFQVRCFNQLMRMDIGYFNNQKAGDIHTIIVSHGRNIGVSLSRFLLNAHLIFTIVMLLSFLIFLSWPITLISLVIFGGVIIVQRSQMQELDRVSRNITPATKNIGSTTLEMIQGWKIIRLFNQEKGALLSFKAAIDRLNEAYYNIGRLQNRVTPITQFTGILGVAIILMAFSFSLVLKTGYGVDVLLIFLVAFNRIIGPVNQINSIRASFKGDLPYYREIFHFLEEGDKSGLLNGTRQFRQLKNEIELKDVTFGYNGKEGIVLKNVSFHVPRGAKVGVVGASGAGKSTLTELLVRFYDPQKGQILIDGVDLKNFDISSWRMRIGVVSQDIFLFNDTIRANIAFGKLDATQEEIESAARKAHVYEFVQEMPEKFYTLVGDRGVRLSGGQKQRIAIARAIIIDPEILIFDEATSALDTESERIVQEALDHVARGRTVLSIAHRFSTIAHYDKILVMNLGQIVEQGKHGELLERNGIYRKLVRMQELSNMNDLSK